ncbi:MAG: hypothetical protein KAJ18_10025 [Candidatus Omnitrophica bacterium]|nr:hypothetical protein [Candidatus Omnitrophota bacterium]
MRETRNHAKLYAKQRKQKAGMGAILRDSVACCTSGVVGEKRALSLSFILVVCCSSCTTVPAIQPQINSLVIAKRFDRALKVFEDHPQGYSEKNRLLYFLDKGLVLHLAGQYEKSIDELEKAKGKYGLLYTRSITKGVGSWLWNDYTKPYRGEDFERVMVNIFQALNYAMLGDISESLVEARDVDSMVSAINQQYDPGQKNVYKEDAFARMLMGILYEASGSSADLNDAFISYRKAYESYENLYQSHYAVAAPRVLKENLLTLAGWMGKEEFRQYRNKFEDVDFLSLADKQKKAQVYLIHYQGLSPLKYPDSIILLGAKGELIKISFPRYKERIFDEEPKTFLAVSKDGAAYSAVTELGENISAIAVKNLRQRRSRIIAKSVGRQAAKYFLQKGVKEKIEENHGKDAGDLFQYGAGLVNLYAEQTDIRAWQTLPAQIRIARLLLDPGEYDLSFDGKDIGHAVVKAGHKKFFIIRTN